MGYEQYLKDLLRPLRVYRLENSYNGAELAAEGAALDGCGGWLEALEREMLVSTAQGPGLDAIERLLAQKPVADTLQRRREALAALLRIGGDSFTLEAVNSNLKGCGLNAVASETGQPGHVEVRFPDVPGIPERFEEMRAIIEDILPCHLNILYVYWYITWELMEKRFQTWEEVECMALTWEELEKLVKEEETYCAG